MHPTRREMLRMGLGSSALLACGPTVPLFLARSANAAAQAKAKGRILVVVQLDGGNDGLNTVVPYNDDEYRKQRPRIQIGTTEVRKIDDHVGLNPALEGFSKLLEQQRLAIVQSVGYPNPNRSHTRSMEIWQTGVVGPAPVAGWLGRAADANGLGATLWILIGLSVVTSVLACFIKETAPRVLRQRMPALVVTGEPRY